MVGDDDSGPAEPEMIGILSAESPPLVKIVENQLLSITSCERNEKAGFSLMLLYTAMLMIYCGLSPSY